MVRLAIIGGGASGLIAAHWLQHQFDVTVFEKRPELGGNIRTFNRNIVSDRVPPDIPLEAGVLGFHKRSGPVLHELLSSLDVPLKTSQPTASLYRHGHYFPSNVAHLGTSAVLIQLVTRPAYLNALRSLRSEYASSFRRITRWDGATDIPVNTLFGDNRALNDFIQSLLALAFSSPFDGAGEIPASLAQHYLKTLRDPDWSYVADGVYSYIERIVQGGRFQVEANCGEVKVNRTSQGATVRAKGTEFEADFVLLAVTPGQVLEVLTDPDDTERSAFGVWRDREISTLLHTDTRFYAPFGKSRKTPMDLLVDHAGDARGYNTSLNGFCGLNTPTPYSFAFGLDAVINPDKVLHETHHTVPTYTVTALQTRNRIKDAQGYRNTYFAGAWLYNGLHEGAAVSARAAADRLLAAKRLQS